MVASRRTVRFRLSVCLLALAVLLANQVPALAGEICRALADATARPCCQPQGPQHDPAPADDDAGDPDCRTCVLCQANGGMLSIIMPQTPLSSPPCLNRIIIDPATALDQSAKDPLVPPPRV